MYYFRAIIKTKFNIAVPFFGKKAKLGIVKYIEGDAVRFIMILFLSWLIGPFKKNYPIICIFITCAHIKCYIILKTEKNVW